MRMQRLFRFEDSLDDPELSEGQVRAIRLGVLLCAALMFGFSWPLWVHQDRFPVVPFFSWVPYLQPAGAWILFVGTFLAMVLALRGNRRFGWVFAAGALLLLLQDQNRFQPWFYQFILITIALCFASPRKAGTLLRLLVTAIYFHSGVSKLDWAFTSETGAFVLGPILGLLGIEGSSDPGKTFRMACLGIALFEVALPFLLVPERTRRWGVSLALAMHGMILFSLGPWGNNWNAIVWPWNLLSAVLVLILFDGRFSDQVKIPFGVSRWDRPLRGLFAFVVLFPLLKIPGWVDAYPSFALYSDRFRYSKIFLSWESSFKISSEIQGFMSEPAIDGKDRVWRSLDPNLWSEEVLGVPLYPGWRTYGAVAAALCAKFDLGEAFVVEKRGLPNRWTGERNMTQVVGCDAAWLDGEGYFFNGQPGRNAFSGKASRGAVQAREAIRRHLEGRRLSEARRMLDSELDRRDRWAAERGRLWMLYSRLHGMEGDGFEAARMLIRKTKTLPEEEDAHAGLVRIYMAAGKLDAALRWAKEAKDLKAKRLGEDHPLSALALVEVARIQERLGRVEEARRNRDEGFKLLRKSAPFHPTLAK